MSSESVQIDYLTTELNYTHSKIVGQDNTIKDLEHKVKILTEKLKISEEKINSDLHRKYFGASSACHAPLGTSCPCTPHQTPSPHTCNCKLFHTGLSESKQHKPIDKDEVDKLNGEIHTIKTDIKEIKSKLSTFTCPNLHKTPVQKVVTASNKSHETIEVEAEVHHDNDNYADNSITSIEELIPELESSEKLDNNRVAQPDLTHPAQTTPIQLNM